LLELIGEKQGHQHHGEELKESDEQKAQRLIKELLRKAGWTPAELKRRKKGDRKKARMAARLRAETPMTWPWIATQLEMGHWRTASNAMRSALSKRGNKH
jgi:transposase